MRLRQLRVLHIGKYYEPHRGGIETYLTSLCDATREYVDVKVLVANDERRDETSMVRSVPVFRASRLLTLASAPICPNMVRKIRECDADLVHIHLPNPGAVLAYLASGRRGPLVVSYHSDTVRQRVLGAAFQPIQNVLLNRASAIIVSSQRYIYSSPVLSTIPQRCHVIPYGIPVAGFNSTSKVEIRRIRERFGSRIVLSVGRLVSYKGFEHLIRAMKDVSAQLVLIGCGPLEHELKSLANELGIGSRVHLLGEIEDPAPYYHAADVFVLPSVSRSEAFGIVQIEAMACRKPVVNTSVDSGVPFVSLHGQTGLTTAPADPAGLSKAINILMDDPRLRARFGEAARNRVEAEFSLEKMANRTLSLYDAVALEMPLPGKRLYPAASPIQSR